VICRLRPHPSCRLVFPRSEVRARSVPKRPTEANDRDQDATPSRWCISSFGSRVLDPFRSPTRARRASHRHEFDMRKVRFAERCCWIDSVERIVPRIAWGTPSCCHFSKFRPSWRYRQTCFRNPGIPESQRGRSHGSPSAETKATPAIAGDASRRTRSRERVLHGGQENHHADHEHCREDRFHGNCSELTSDFIRRDI
jgi:hypothetical protein